MSKDMTGTAVGSVERMADGWWSVSPADGREEKLFEREDDARAYLWNADGHVSRGRRVHHVKIEKGWADCAVQGMKQWELRKNDRRYEVGDRLVMHEIVTDGQGRQVATGRVIVRDILMVAAPEGLAPGYVILSLGDAE